MSVQNILVIGAGELGTSVLTSLAHHPRRPETTLSVLLRPTTITSTHPTKAKEISTLRNLNITLVPGDISLSPLSSLTSTFRNYDTIISCTGFSAGPGTQLKLARAVLAANTPRFIPWQFGVDYDIIGRGSAQDLFDEQLDVRDLLRGQNKTKWVIISTGMFTSFLFEPWFGVVDLRKGAVTALGGWENEVTVTAPGDIGRITAEVVLGYEGLFTDNGRVVYVAGDTISYGRLAELVERLSGKRVVKGVRTVEEAREDLERDPENGLYKYQVVFGEGRGVAWELAEAWNVKMGMKVLSAEEWAKQHLEFS